MADLYEIINVPVKLVDGSGNTVDVAIKRKWEDKTTHYELATSATATISGVVDVDATGQGDVPVTLDGEAAEIYQDASSEQTFTIPDTGDGSAVDPVDLGAAYDLIWVRCEDCQYIQASTNMTALVKHVSGDTLCDLYEQDDPSTQWSAGALPTSGTMAFLLSHAAGIRHIRLVLSNAASGGAVVLKVKGFHKSE